MSRCGPIEPTRGPVGRSGRAARGSGRARAPPRPAPGRSSTPVPVRWPCGSDSGGSCSASSRIAPSVGSAGSTLAYVRRPRRDCPGWPGPFVASRPPVSSTSAGAGRACGSLTRPRRGPPSGSAWKRRRPHRLGRCGGPGRRAGLRAGSSPAGFPHGLPVRRPEGRGPARERPRRPPAVRPSPMPRPSGPRGPDRRCPSTRRMRRSQGSWTMPRTASLDGFGRPPVGQPEPGDQAGDRPGGFDPGWRQALDLRRRGMFGVKAAPAAGRCLPRRRFERRYGGPETPGLSVVRLRLTAEILGTHPAGFQDLPVAIRGNPTVARVHSSSDLGHSYSSAGRMRGRNRPPERAARVSIVTTPFSSARPRLSIEGRCIRRSVSQSQCSPCTGFGLECSGFVSDGERFVSIISLDAPCGSATPLPLWIGRITPPARRPRSILDGRRSWCPLPPRYPIAPGPGRSLLRRYDPDQSVSLGPSSRRWGHLTWASYGMVVDEPCDWSAAVPAGRLADRLVRHQAPPFGEWRVSPQTATYTRIGRPQRRAESAGPVRSPAPQPQDASIPLNREAHASMISAAESGHGVAVAT